jgi:hypothetical protein
VQPEKRHVRAWTEVASAFRALVRPPFVTLLLLNALIAVVTVSISARLGPNSPDDLATLGQTSMLALDVVAIYVQIALVLAAGSAGDSPSADIWMRAAFRHRCFWRFLGTTIIVVVLVMIGFAALAIGAVIAGGIIGVAQAGVVLERLSPFDALRRSAALTKPARGQVAAVFSALLLLPLVAGAISVVVKVDLSLGVQLALSLGGTVFSFAAAIALTRMFVKLGGSPTPPVQTLLYKSAAGRP